MRISHDYFRIRKAIDRRLYEIARKHCCGAQHEFVISTEKLHSKTGSTSNKAEFKRLVKKLCAVNDLPDYEVFYCKEKDQVIFKNRNQDKPEAEHSKRRKSGKKAIHNIKKHQSRPNGRLPLHSQAGLSASCNRMDRLKMLPCNNLPCFPSVMGGLNIDPEIIVQLK